MLQRLADAVGSIWMLGNKGPGLIYGGKGSRCVVRPSLGGGIGSATAEFGGEQPRKQSPNTVSIHLELQIWVFDYGEIEINQS